MVIVAISGWLMGAVMQERSLIPMHASVCKWLPILRHLIKHFLTENDNNGRPRLQVWILQLIDGANATAPLSFDRCPEAINLVLLA